MENQSILQTLESEACKVENTENSIVFFLDDSKVHYIKDYFSLSKNIEIRSIDKEKRATLIIDNAIHSFNDMKLFDLNFIGHLEIKASAHFYAYNCNFEPRSETDNSVIDTITSGQSIFCNCNFKGGKLSAIRGATTARIHIYYCIFNECRNSAISGSNCNVIISNCTFLSSTRYAIFLEKRSDFKIENCIFKSLKSKAIVCTWNSNCNCENCDFLQIEKDGITISEKSSLTLKNCIFSDILFSCIIVERNSQATITNSSFQNSNKSAILFNNSAGLIKANYFNNMQNASFYILGCKSGPIITNNQIINTQNSPAAIVKDCAVPVFDNILIDTSNSHGFFISDFAKPVVSNTTIKNISKSAFCVSNGASLNTDNVTTENCTYDYESFTKGKFLKCNINHHSKQEYLKTNIHHGGIFKIPPTKIKIWGSKKARNSQLNKENKNDKQEKIETKILEKPQPKTESDDKSAVGSIKDDIPKKSVQNQIKKDGTDQFTSSNENIETSIDKKEFENDKTAGTPKESISTQDQPEAKINKELIKDSNQNDPKKETENPENKSIQEQTQTKPKEENSKPTQTENETSSKTEEITKPKKDDDNSKQQDNDKKPELPESIDQEKVEKARSEGFSKNSVNLINKANSSSITNKNSQNQSRQRRHPQSVSLTRTYGTNSSNSRPYPKSFDQVSPPFISPKRTVVPNASSQSSVSNESSHTLSQSKQKSSDLSRTISQSAAQNSSDTSNSKDESTDFSYIQLKARPLSLTSYDSSQQKTEEQVKQMNTFLNKCDLSPLPAFQPVRADRSSFKFIDDNKREPFGQNLIDIGKLYEQEKLESTEILRKTCLLCNKETDQLLVCSPCGHQCVCKECREQIMNSDKKFCPLCSLRVNEIKLPFVSENCLICMDAPSDTILMPCFHKCVCYRCATEMWQKSKTCPECSKTCSSFKHIFDIPDN